MNMFFKKLSSLLEDNSGSWSSMRFSHLFTVINSNIVIFGVWAIICIMKKDILDFPGQVVTIYTLANGITFGGKIAQKHFENKEMTITNESSSSIEKVEA